MTKKITKETISLSESKPRVLPERQGTVQGHRDGFGLLGIKERIYEMHGKINIVSKPKFGTSLIIQMPIQK